jgi:hypothetical protein
MFSFEPIKSIEITNPTKFIGGAWSNAVVLNGSGGT